MLVLVIPVLVLVLVLVLLLVLLPVLLASRAAPRTLLVLLFLLVLVPHVRRRRAQQQTTLCWLSFPAKTVLGEPICVSPLSLPPRFKLPAGQEAHWHALQGMAFLGAAGRIFLGGALQGLFLPKGRRSKQPGPMCEWRGRDGGQPPVRLH